MRMLPHKGEVLVLFDCPVTDIALPPEAARNLAKQLIENAELAEQQMDAEQGSGG